MTKTIAKSISVLFLAIFGVAILLVALPFYGGATPQKNTNGPKGGSNNSNGSRPVNSSNTSNSNNSNVSRPSNRRYGR